MTKKYVYSLFFILSLLSFKGFSQEKKDNFNTSSRQEQPVIEDLSIYPNPTTTGKIYISSKLTTEKRVEIFDVLGKKVLEGATVNKELNVSTLSPGVYIIKIKENDRSATRKLIVK